MTEPTNPFLIPPPPRPQGPPPAEGDERGAGATSSRASGDAETPTPTPNPTPTPTPTDDTVTFIDLPPGVIDSATFKVEPSRVSRPPRGPAEVVPTVAVKEEITFFPAPIGAPITGGGWVLALPDGTELAIESGRMLIGRGPAEPAGTPGSPDPRLVSVVDPAKSVSKTHAEFAVVDGRLFVTDLGSTNGIALGAEGHEDELIEPAVPTPVGDGRIVALGTFEIVVRRA
ncbi:MAG: hypothetical protein RI885_1197 [Actinomycetota bacterium]